MKANLLAIVCALGFSAVNASAQAALVTYDYEITGDVFAGDETAPNPFGLRAGDTIAARGTFTADLSSAAVITVLFGLGSGNTMSINLNGTLLEASDDDAYGDGGNPSLTFNSLSLMEFNFSKLSSSPSFVSSSFLYFDDTGSLFGQWRSEVMLDAVPIPAAVWLFGSGLLGMIGIARQKKAA